MLNCLKTEWKNYRSCEVFNSHKLWEKNKQKYSAFIKPDLCGRWNISLLPLADNQSNQNYLQKLPLSVEGRGFTLLWPGSEKVCPFGRGWMPPLLPSAPHKVRYRWPVKPTIGEKAQISGREVWPEVDGTTFIQMDICCKGKTWSKILSRGKLCL